MLRGLTRSLAALVLLVTAGAIGWRVLGPAEVLSPAGSPYPTYPAIGPGVIGRTNVAPLIVDGRLRVYAGKRQVRADAPVDAKTVNTARWSFRRWPEQLSGVVAIGPTVISRWSDGDLVAIDGRTGKIAWRASAGSSAPGYDGHRTGSATVWSPAGLHVGEGTVVVQAGETLTAYDGGTGARRWQVSVPASCAAPGFTTAAGQYVCPTGAYDAGTGAALTGWPAGPFTPLGCSVAATHCAGFRDGAGQGWFTDGPAPRRVAALDRPGSTVVAGLVLVPTGVFVEARDAGDTVLHRYPAASVLGASEGRLVLLAPGNRLLEVDPRAGTTIADFPLAVGTERLDWTPGRRQVVDGFVAIERLATGGPPGADTPGHYFTTDTVILAAL